MTEDNSKNAIIKVRNLKKSYNIAGGEKRAEVLKGINLDIIDGEFAIIFGPSGSGKSTLLHQIVGLELPTEGQIWLKGVEVTKLNSEQRATLRAEKVGMVYQIWHWAKALNVWENVAVPLLLEGYDFSQAKPKAIQSLEDIGMGDYAYKTPLHLSGGEQQRICLARALVNDPVLIIADEPTGNLDTHNSDNVMSIFDKLNKTRKKTIVMVTHDMRYLPMATQKIAVEDGMVTSRNSEEVVEQIRDELKRAT